MLIKKKIITKLYLIIASSLIILPSLAHSQTIKKNLVILLRFSDHQNRTLPTQQDFNVFMNSNTTHPTLAPTGSFKTYYKNNSYGKFDPQSTITKWINLPNTESYYAGGNSALRGAPKLRDEAIPFALTQIDNDPSINLADFDSDNDQKIDFLTVFHSGRGAEIGGTDEAGVNPPDRIWAHQGWVSSTWRSSAGLGARFYATTSALHGLFGTDIARLALIAHEFGHALDLPDLYDGDESNGDGLIGSGISSHGLMGTLWGADASGWNPPPLSAWSKETLGWVTPTIISQPGTYSISKASISPQVFKINRGFGSQEYFLIENRSNNDGSGGLAIWHIDNSASNTTEGYPGDGLWPSKRYKVALMQADGRFDLQRDGRADNGDFYTAAGQSEISPNTVPDTDSYYQGRLSHSGLHIYDISNAGTTMTFKVDFQVTPPPIPTTLTTTVNNNAEVTINWTDNATNENGFILQRAKPGEPFEEIANLSPNSNSFLDTTTLNGGSFTYRVASYVGNGVSKWSNSSTASVAPPGESTPYPGMINWARDPIAVASQSTPMQGTTETPASRAIDGNISGRWIDNSISQTANFRTSWTVNLGKTRIINKIRIFNRHLDGPLITSQLSNFSIIIEKQFGPRWLPVTSKDFYTLEGHVGESEVWDTGGVEGDRVVIRLIDKNRLSNWTLALAEVEVWGPDPLSPNTDSDGDGLSDIIEEFLGSNPQIPNTGPVITNVDNNGTITMSHTINPSPAAPLTGTYEWSPNLKDWYQVSSNNGPPSGLTVTANLNSPTTPIFTPNFPQQNIFLRLRVTQN